MNQMVHIGELIKKDYIESGMQARAYAKKLGVSRSNLYNLFGRQSIDTQQLFQICVSTGVNFFKYYDLELKKKDPIVFWDDPKVQNELPAREAWIKVNLSEVEYQNMKNKL